MISGIARILGLVCSVALASSLGLGCRAADEERRGDVGEFCNGRDDDCRAGLQCEEGVCQFPGPVAGYQCSDVCARMRECEAVEEGCTSDCRATVVDWSASAVEVFTTCLVEDLQCAEFREDFGPQTCYSRIPVPEGRSERCDEFLSAAQECRAGVDASELRSACRAASRVLAAEKWSETDRCVNAVQTGICSGIARCFNDEFDLAPPIDLGDEMLN